MNFVIAALTFNITIQTQFQHFRLSTEVRWYSADQQLLIGPQIDPGKIRKLITRKIIARNSSDIPRKRVETQVQHLKRLDDVKHIDNLHQITRDVVVGKLDLCHTGIYVASDAMPKTH